MKHNLILFILFLNFGVYSQEKTFVREFTYNASDIDSKVSSRAIATKELKSLLLNEVGVYVESESILTTSEVGDSFSQNFIENIKTITAGITKLEVIEESWNGYIYWIKASITINKNELRESLKQLINDRQKLKELEEVRQKLKLAEIEISNINKQLQGNNAKNLDELSKKYNQEIKKITAFELFESGHAKATEKNYESAIVDFSIVLKIDSNFAMAYLNRGISFQRLNKHKEAISDFSKALKLDSELSEAYFFKGVSIQHQGNFPKAIENYTIAIRLYPDYSEAYFSRGFAYSALGMDLDAINDYTKAIEIKPDMFQCYFFRASSLLNLKKYNEAIQDYTNAIRLNSDYKFAYLERGISYSHLGKYRESIQDFSICIKLDPNFDKAFYNRGLNYFLLENYKEAIEDLTTAIRIKPIEANYLIRGDCYMALENFSSAISDFSKAIEINPSSSNGYYSKGFAQIIFDQKEEGCLNIKKAHELGFDKVPTEIEEYCF